MLRKQEENLVSEGKSSQALCRESSPVNSHRQKPSSPALDADPQIPVSSAAGGRGRGRRAQRRSEQLRPKLVGLQALCGGERGRAQGQGDTLSGFGRLLASFT